MVGLPPERGAHRARGGALGDALESSEKEGRLWPAGPARASSGDGMETARGLPAEHNSETLPFQ